MPTSNFKTFADNATSILSDAAYEADTQRLNGVAPGIARDALHNKLYRQCVAFPVALARLIVARGYDALDNDINGLVAGLKRLFCMSIDGVRPDENGNINILTRAYPVGAVFITTVSGNPADILGFGTWSQIKDRFLLAAGDSYAAASTGGASSVVLDADQMPVHTHVAGSSAAGSHSHTINANGSHSHTINSAGAHQHGLSMNTISGVVGRFNSPFAYNQATGGGETSGCFSIEQLGATRDIKEGGGGDWSVRIKFSAQPSGSIASNGSHTHTMNGAGSHDHTAVANGSHSHSVTVNNAGRGQAHNNMPPYLAVYVWKRVS